ncbi:MAG: hypothetical protein R3Y28_05350 [Candidatus Gastranaerophilales bacterium]
MYSKDGKVFIEEQDQCMNCVNYANKVSCPLLSALGLGVVYLEDSLTVTNCGFYEEFKRNLHIVKNEAE